MDNRRKKQLLLVGLLLGCLITGLLNSTKDFVDLGKVPQRVTVKPSEGGNGTKSQLKVNKKTKESKERITIQVSGAVLRPGLYSLPINTSVEEAILMAGGLKQEANTDKLNYAKVLKDGSMLYVPSKRGSGSKAAKKNLKAQQPETIRVNLNTASQQELESLPGIGPAMAVKILSRRQIKPFSRVEELMEISGIGKVKLVKLKPYVTL